MTVGDRVKGMSVNELYDAAHGKGGVTGYDNSLASPTVWAEAATEELKRRGYNVPDLAAQDQAAVPDDPISADAHFIAMSASKDAGRIIKHLWIIFVLLPVVLAILFAILK
jgi:hypothetical protein